MSLFLKVARKHVADISAATGDDDAEAARKRRGYETHAFSVQRRHCIDRLKQLCMRCDGISGVHVSAPLPCAERANDDDDDRGEDDEGNPEHPTRHHKAIFADAE
jgi:hypothetical protein